MIHKISKGVFNFLSSVKLAIPAMLTLIVVIAIGTIIESRYNAEYAKLLVYQSRWFSALLILIWINVLFAALSRWPWKPRHAGFLITHLGLLLLFGGGFVTNVYGVDGSLRIEQGGSGDAVVLPDFVIGARANRESNPIFYSIRRPTSAQDESFFKDINEKLSGVAVLRAYQPFVEVQEITKAGGTPGTGPLELQFRIKSAFFDVDESLNSAAKPFLQMGPATFKIEKRSEAVVAKKSTPKPAKAPIAEVKPRSKQRGGSHFVVSVNGQESILPINESIAGKSITVQGFKVLVKKWVPHAVVVNNSLQDNPQGSDNPAMEIEIQHGNDKIRDVLYARFPTFSLRQGKWPELVAKLDIATGGATEAAPVSAIAVGGEMPAGHPQVSAQTGEASGSGSTPAGNTVIFGYSEQDTRDIEVVLIKAGKEVSRQKLHEGQSFVTPWMGMELTLKKIVWNAQKEVAVVPTEPREKQDSLPPSAVLLNRFNGAPAEETWLVEGDERGIQFDGREYFIYFGKRIMNLPFSLKLKQFKKSDYPGTSMAKEYESEVEATGILSPIRISMNQPLNYQGYTIYQASYEQLPSGEYASIFSVNYDPGRWIKYLGGIVLGIGIITFTVTRSRRYQQWRSKAT
jgi:hypothetical protein